MMTCKYVLRHVVLLTLVVSLCSLGLWADSTSDPCSLTAPSCTATCTSSPCQVQITQSGSSLSLSYNGTNASVLCAGDNSTVTWAPSSATPSLVGAFFSSTHYPGNTSVVTGSNSNAASTSVTAGDPSLACYVYQIVVCNSSGSCGVLDPKVVVTGVTIEGKKKKKDK
jgi:hypothetical protein